MTSRPYADKAEQYWNQGWHGVVPIPPKRKKMPPEGFTGRGKPMPSYPDMLTWMTDRPDSNIGIRVPLGIVGIDVDAYGGKHGARTLAEAERLWGELPPTWKSTSRADDPVSGIRLYRVHPEVELPGIVEVGGMSDIETVQNHHRYIVCNPSIHPEGRVYRWYGPDGTECELPPPPEDPRIPWLPQRWVDALRVEARRAVDLSSGARIELTTGVPSATVQRALSEGLTALTLRQGSRHESALKTVAQLLRLSERKEPGVDRAMDALRQQFLRSTTRPGEGQRSVREAEAEFDSMLTGLRIHAEIAATPSNEGLGLMRPEEPPSRPAGHTAPAMTGSTPVGYAGDDDDDPMDDGVIRDADGQPSRAIELGVAPMSGAKRNWASNADVPEVQEWLATDRIPLGEITLLCGEEGIGKSLFWVWLVALLTTGRGCPEFGIEPGPPRYVFVIATEDAWGKTVAPRLKAAGADMDYIGYTATDVDEGVPIMPHDFPLLTDPWDGKEPALIVVDAWVDTTESSVKLPHVREARASIVPWRKVAQELNTAVLLLTHTNRDTSGELRNRYGNSGELRKLARAALFATKGEEPDEMLVALDKANLATQRHHSLLFTGEMVTVRARRSDGTWTDTPIRRLTLAGEDPRRIDEVLRERADDAADRDSRDCKTWLRDYMVRNQGSAKATEVQSAARAEGYSVSTLRRARVALGVTSSKHVDHYIWSM